MSLQKPARDKMMTAAPALKGFHFASDGIHEAVYIEAATIEEAQAIYHKTKKLKTPAVGGTVEESTPAPAESEEKSVE